MSGRPQPDQHLHEHGTCFNVRGRGLVVITSCGHAGIINTVRRAQQVSGVEKVYALVGGFHLAPAPADYLGKIMAELKTLDIDIERTRQEILKEEKEHDRIAAEAVPLPNVYDTVGALYKAIRNAFERQKDIEYSISTISSKDLTVTKENDKVVVSFAYDKEVELVKPVYLLIKFEGRSN